MVSQGKKSTKGFIEKNEFTTIPVRGVQVALLIWFRATSNLVRCVQHLSRFTDNVYLMYHFNYVYNKHCFILFIFLKREYADL